MTIAQIIVDSYNAGYRDGFAEGTRQLAAYEADMKLMELERSISEE